MAITILPGQSYGSQIGTGLGNVLGGSLQNLAQLKLQQLLQQQQEARAIPGLSALGFAPEQAQSLAALDPSIQREIVKQQLAGPSNQLFAQALNDALGGSPQSQSLQQTLGMQGSAGAKGQQGSIAIPAGIKPQQALQLAQIKQAQTNLTRKEQLQEQRESDKETLPFYKTTLKEAQAARNNDKRLNRMEELIKTGKLSSTGFESLLKTLSHGIFGLGIDLSGLRNPESQEFEKLSNDFIKDAKEIFGGGRLTDADLAAFLKTIPTLSLSNEGKLRVMENMRRFNEASKLKEKALRQVIKENNGRRPRNIEILVDEKIAPQLDALSDQFKSTLQAPPDNSLVGDVLRATLPSFITRNIQP